MTRRISRLNSLIREEISDLLQRQVKDPQLDRFVSVTEISTSPDLSYAKVFVSIMGSEEEKRATLERLTAASGFFRKELSKRLTTRRVPELNFCQDNSIEQGAHLLEIIERISDSSIDQASVQSSLDDKIVR